MRALIGRELRARSTFFFLALAAASLGIWSGALFSQVGPHIPFLNVAFSLFERLMGYSLLSRVFLNGLFIGSLFMALLLGYLQVATESKHGTEAFLLHQPVGRGRILAAKLIAGLLLYLSALLAPFASYVFWVASPWGHFGPFRWEMAYPALIQIIAALLAYPAALWLTAARGRERVVGVAAMLVALAKAIFIANLCEPAWSEGAVLFTSLVLSWGAAHAYAEREL